MMFGTHAAVHCPSIVLRDSSLLAPYPQRCLEEGVSLVRSLGAECGIKAESCNLTKATLSAQTTGYTMQVLNTEQRRFEIVLG